MRDGGPERRDGEADVDERPGCGAGAAASAVSALPVAAERKRGRRGPSPLLRPEVTGRGRWAFPSRERGRGTRGSSGRRKTRGKNLLSVLSPREGPTPRPSLPPLYVLPSAHRLPQFHHVGGEGDGPGPAILDASLAMGARI